MIILKYKDDRCTASLSVGHDAIFYFAQFSDVSTRGLPARPHSSRFGFHTRYFAETGAAHNMSSVRFNVSYAISICAPFLARHNYLV
eukprot:2068199-Pyramimonas_sp.AAC.1